MELNDLTPEQRAKLDGCESPEEVLALAQAEGVELSDAELEAVSGGMWGESIKPCPYCNSKNIRAAGTGVHLSKVCSDCGEAF